MKHKNSLNDETNSLFLASTESRSIILGEEASSNRTELYYENQKNLLRAHFERKKQKSNQLPISILKSPLHKQQSHQPVSSKSFPKTAPPRLETASASKQLAPKTIQRPSLIKEVSALSNSSRNSSIRYSAREKTIIEWAFKRFEEEIDLEKIEKEKKKKKSGRFVHQFWYENDEEILNGSSVQNSISLNESTEKDDFDFYRTNRKAVTTKTDIEINRQSKQLGTRLIDLSKERYKVIGILDYEKKKFVRNQMLKSESLPGLR